MSLRAVLLGLCLAMAILSVTYFNDQIVRQTYLINHHLPAPVFVAGFALLLGLNPLLRRWRRRPWSVGEVGVVLALSLAVCGWPGTSFFRYFTHMFALPAVEEQVRSNWQANRVLAYVPGEHGRIGVGHLRHPEALRKRLTAATPETDPAAYRFVRPIADRIGSLDVDRLAAQLEQALQSSDLADAEAFAGVALEARTRSLLEQHLTTGLAPERVPWLNRLLLEATFAEDVVPLRRGRGVLPAEGRWDAAVHEPLLAPTVEGRPTVTAVPWEQWWPTIRLWGGAAVLTAMAVLCLMLVVHPQWSRRELLSYPTVQLVQEAARPGAGGRWPTLLTDRMFWLGFGGVAVMHTLNGLHAWYPEVPQIVRRFDFSPMDELFPNAARASGFNHLANPVLYPTAIGMAFLIRTRVAFSVGLALPMWVAFSAVLIGWGVDVSNHRNTVESMGPSLRFGAFVGIGLMVFYFGRHYYLRVMRAAVGGRHDYSVPGYAPWAMRGLVIFSALASLLLWRYAGMDLWLAAAILGMVMLASVVLARLNAEAGLFYVQPDWYPAMILLAFLGTPAMGPELMIVVLIASFLLMPDPREGISPFLINALRLTETGGADGPRRAVPWLALVLAGGFVVAMGATLGLQYHYGISLHDVWAPSQAANVFQPVSAAIGEMVAREQILDAVQRDGLERLQAFQPSGAMLGWMIAGFALVIGCMGLGLRLPWWPIHPVLFVIWGTFPSYFFGVSFLLGAIIKRSTVSVVGERGFHVVKPLMIGLIVADLTMILVWMVVGIAYFAVTGLSPESYHILPL